MATCILALITLATTFNSVACEYESTNVALPRISYDDFQQLLHRVNDLEEKNVAQELKLGQQGRRLAQQERKIAQQEGTLVRQQGEMEALRANTVAELARVAEKTDKFNVSDYLQVRSRRAQNEMTVGFFAVLTKQLLHMGAHQDIIFDKVITNVGNGYNVHLGSFIAPVSGIYVFSAFLTAYGSAHASLFEFTRNGNQESLIYLRGSAESPYSSSTEMAVFELNQGDDVQIRNTNSDGYLHAGYSSFSGFLLQQTYSAPVVVG